MTPTALPPSVKSCTHYHSDGSRRAISLEQVHEVMDSGEGFVWIGLYEPDLATLERMRELFDLHRLAIEDAAKAHQRPKVEAFGNTLFVVMHTSQQVENKLRYGETHAFLGERFLITIRHAASLSYEPVRERLELEPELLRLGPSVCLWAVLDAVVDNYLPITEEFTTTLDGLEKAIFADRYKRSTVRRLYELKREVNLMRMAVSPLQDVLSQLRRHPGKLIADEVRLYLRDVHDHVARVADTVDTLRDMLGTALSVNLSLVTLAQGETVKRLGAWAALLAAPTLITSWYGMNFADMPELDSPYAYPILGGAVLLACIVLYRLFKRAGWL
jgi:magnesium transporter